MGAALSMCGLSASDGNHDPQLHYQRKDFGSDLDRTSGERGRSLSTATDSSVASILSNSEQLIPDAFMPKDIQVLSQRRQRLGPHHMASRSSYASSSRVSNSSARGAGTVRVVRNNAADAVDKSYAYGIKTASSSFGYSDDDETNNPANRRVDNNRLSVQELRVK
ncbi:hypothetical protein PRIC1_010052 [Phytophthora ramorum]|uniref:Uncharacterized protein n=1 Tax=Phytophthora ramorum TaxID=164328 RepID=H3H3V2_PHYRM|nr:hypothetical protein KRP22_11533 [Phytophthora ramorum]KAH7499264.1 hypothetical protein KRP22_10754 [Phytophthora ramorum]